MTNQIIQTTAIGLKGPRIGSLVTAEIIETKDDGDRTGNVSVRLTSHYLPGLGRRRIEDILVEAATLKTAMYVFKEILKQKLPDGWELNEKTQT